VTRHFVTDRRRFGLAPSALAGAAARAAQRGADVVQVRERDLADVALLALVRDIVAGVRLAGTRVLVNDRADVAIAAGAAGVHLRGDSPPASRLRRFVPPGFIVGRSVHSLDDIDAAVADGGCDYLMFGTVFASAGKPPGHPVAGIDRLAEACRRSALPIVAIGGITPEREPDIARAGAAGLAAVGWFM
jgi:thiamine-phosphate pyrophosphorylase